MEWWKFGEEVSLNNMGDGVIEQSKLSIGKWMM